MKALIYAPGEVPVVAEVRDFAHIQEICGGYVERVILHTTKRGGRRSVELWCNEDGIGLGLPINIWAEGPRYAGAPIFGPAVILASEPGPDGDESVGLTEEETWAWMLLRRAILVPKERP